MQLAILHHHLNRGGVTSVIANHLRSLATLPESERPERVVVLYDGQHQGWPEDLPPELSIALVEEAALAYDAADTAYDPEQLADLLSDRLDRCGLQPGDTLLHVHNHSLGKNAALPKALEHLAGEGWPLLLQIHDFAEDNRPKNYEHLQSAIEISDADELGQILYPQDKGIHYATLTQRDAEVLRTAGFAEERLHVLPNPVAEFSDMPSCEQARPRVLAQLGLPAKARLIVYPVRGIRRKNLGEMLLLSALSPEETYFAVTLRPKNPVEAASFDRWRRLAESLDLPCLFDTGSPKEEGGYGCNFQETLAAADAILTTSIAEGFGMVFLEAWLAGKPLIGRDLPEITREFKAVGIEFPGMWEEMRAAANLDSDFGQLTAAEQVAALQGTSVPSLPLDFGLETYTRVIESNAALVREHYSTEQSGRRLAAAYSATWNRSDGPSAVLGSSIVRHYEAPERQQPVRFEEVPDDPQVQKIAQLSAKLTPEETGEDPKLAQLPGIRAVVFDVYGTLLVSGSGDISLASEGSRGEAARQALQSALGEPATSVGGVAASTEIDGDAIVEALLTAIKAAHAESTSDHPEVEIREIWKSVLDDFAIKATDTQIEDLAIDYECRVNPIWPMPGCSETLAMIRQAGLELGIVSNAQFFTPLAFPALTSLSLEAHGFDPELCIWSYEHREAKPGTFLYERAAEALASRGIKTDEALFVGNDLRNDVWPAQQIGFKTALFAGDARSLRWRHDDDRLAEIRPDTVVTNLRQLLEILL